MSISWPEMLPGGAMLASERGIVSFHSDGTVLNKVIPNNMAQAPMITNYSSQNVAAHHHAESLPLESLLSVRVSINHRLPFLVKYLPPDSSVSHSSSFSIISNASISSFQSANMESMGWTFLPQLTLGVESSAVSDCS